jgi:hypothetical protein
MSSVTLYYQYKCYPKPQPIVSLGGRHERPKPVIAVALLTAHDTVTRDCLLDTGADDTIFPEDVATQLGIDLSNAPSGTASGVGLVASTVRYAKVTFRITDGHEQCEWEGWVGFTSARLHRPLLGHAGFLQFFDATFRGEAEIVELTPNSAYAGT